ncbi:zonadhesin-like isoform X16 [Mytilus californianus]|uniref:zonadhesin-like isoform X7 n=1 Tax=Mytilus californianus TaxID=6549 RepID=UPI002246327E|nr:zonadhesin-like isoform X7 [Mytilus californianus]XP_052106231.1 zonadhesin-like isoform X10 [Mytilus californianus]XP_052106237.1 zonadhesin-like isoform X15 [Mytilus californianus]XP_052106238.1 zonadhesin-like isoform X16 [Mytilus californianus]
MEARPGVFLLLLVTVLQAVASKKEVICENSKTTLSCPPNQIIRIQQATYGRSNKRTCKHPKIKTTRCSTKKPLGITRKNCNGRKSCAVAANNGLYGDPCPGTYKYVTVSYSCQGTTRKCRKKCHKKAKCINGKCVCKAKYQGDGVRSCKNKKDKTPKCMRKCHRQANCIRGKCVCKSGYKGDGIRSCTNIKVKTPKCLRRCHRKAKCIRGKCVCKSGYKGDGIRSCSNIKAQTPKCMKKCHKKAKCINRKCVCKAKYHGDGVRSCTKDKGKKPKCLRKCHKYAKCKKGKCICKSGYRGDGIRSCTNNKVKTPKCLRRCHRKAKCIRGKCVCKSGYKGDGIRSCSNIKVKTPKCMKKCHKKAKCINRKCVCKAKYHGDGVRSCTKDKGKTPKCLRKCHKYAKCKKGKCICKSGYRGDGIRSCTNNKDNTPKCMMKCHKKARCIKGKCVCKAKYQGDGVRSCTKNKDKTPKCTRKCHKKARCIKGKCVCKAKYQGDGVRSCTKGKESAYIGCYQDDSTRILPKEVLKDKGMTVQKCQQFCGQKGFKFAGVEYGYECFCGNVLRKDRKRKERDCKTPCSGNKQQICGGTWRISIYTAKTSKCMNKCHKKAKCIKGKCVCKAKYQGNGVKSCKKVKRCRSAKKIQTPNAYKYKLLSDYGISVDNHERFSIKFKVMAKNDAHLALMSSNNEKDPLYELVLGGWGNSKSVVRDKKQGRSLSEHKGKMLRPNKLESFKVIWNKGKIRVEDGRGKKIMEWTDTSNPLKIRDIGISTGWGATGTWSFPCQGKPSNCKEKCHKNGKCKKGRCRCKKGYTGDGINVCSKSCTCSATGDPHYRSFDGQVLHFMGTCKYTLSQYVNPKSACRFHVQVKNENRGNKRVSYTRSVHVVVRKTKIDLLKNRVVKVDGIKRYLPYKTGYFSIINSGRYVRLKTTCNVIITWDGRSAATISVPSHFSQNLIGLCGNCNGIKDDFRTKDGLDVRTKPDKFTLIGESYLIREGNGEKCGVSIPPDPCTSTLRNKAIRNTACGQLNPVNPSSPFRDCSIEDVQLVQDIYDSCVYDYCAYSDQPDILNTVVCEAAEGLEERCENMGFDISWRTKQFCPFICEDNMEYSSAVSGCPATCVDLDASKTCKLPPSEGCQCKKGFVLSDNTCIPRAQCGCRLPTGEYYPIDTEITSRDCRTVSKCVATKSGYAKMQVIRRQKCHRNAQCKLLNGVYDCACEEGFKGDGIKICKGKPEPGTDKVICEGLKGSITCPGKKTIRILEATYGRIDMSTCKDPRVKTTSCSSNKPLPIIRKNCDGIKSCIVSANNGLYGDPCGGTYKYVTVRYVCEETGPKCGSTVCHPDAKCHRGRCVCRKGFVGDGVNSCTGTCTCVASGDPHYKSFDGQVIHFMGICTYTMVKSTSIDKCGGFEVQVQNEHRGANTKVSYTQYVLVKLADATIRLDKNNVVFVNDVQVYTPYSCTNFEITTSGRYVRLQTKCNILITWNGVGTVAVSVPKTYSGVVTGLCGDCNGKKDDFRTSTGEDVRLKKDKFELIGKSYTVPGIYETQDNKCVVGPVIEEPCSAEQSSKAADDKYCGFLNPKNVKSPFMSCANKDMDMAKDLYESCLYDYCSLAGSPELEQFICESLEGYEEQCENMGLSITWRRKDFCQLTCPENMDYTTSGSGCPATCLDPDAPLTCRLPNTEGCQCKEGFLLSGNECVPKAKCGCRGPEGEYYPLGKQLTSSDCTIVTKCSSENGKPTMTVVKQQICHQNAKCRLRRGQYRCICKQKFKGNGVDVCTHKCNRKCKINERCVKGKCRCEKGLVRTKLGACTIKIPCKPKCKKGFVCSLLGKCRPKGCKRKCKINERCFRGKCRCNKGLVRTKLGACKTKIPCEPKCKSGFVCSFRGKCRPQGCKRKCRINERCVKGQCRCKKGSYRIKLGACKTKIPCKPKCKSGFVCSFRGKCRPKGCKQKCRINERCVKGKCRCKKGSFRTKLGACKTKVPCKPKCESGFVCSFLGKCRPKGCKRKCRVNERCVKGKCRCKKGSFRTKLGACKTKIPCKPKCKSGFVCSFRGKCRPKGCKQKCRINERCVKGKCRCKKGSFRTKLGACKTKIPCEPKCETGFVCSFLGKCRPKGCKRKCRINERCVKGKCRCKKGSVRTKLGACKTKIPCTPKCQSGFVCSFLGKCRPKGCKRKCRINERCVKGKCRCKKGSFRTKLGTCKKRCNINSCGVNAVCVKRKYCRCKKGYAGHPKTLCEEVKECIKNARGNDYIGRMSTTESGRTCQAWNKQTPHRHSKSNVGDAKNYCRNLDNEPRPWCYTTDSRKRWEFCRIPICGAPKPPCGDMVIMACHSDRQHRTECRVSNAERINYIELQSGENNPSCTFGVTYGFYGVTIWSKESCREKIKVCLTPKNRVPILPPPEECRNTEKGEDYVGKWSKTETGKNCQRWDQQYPHQHAFFLDGKDSENYCRNFDGSARPWCYTEDPYTEREYCAIHKCAPEDPEDVDECRKSTKGTEYKGRISLTQTGRTCQYWERQYPQKHVFSNLKTEHNYCRNPDNSGQPWCYTNDPTTRWEYCQIPMCAACSIREEIVECKATVRVSGSCFYKSKVGSSCVYTVQLSDSQAIIKTSTQEMVLTNGGNLAECAIFTFNDGTLKIEDDVCKCFEVLDNKIA